MSHDRGCHCGRERDEYRDCPRTTCTKRVLGPKAAELIAGMRRYSYLSQPSRPNTDALKFWAV